METTGNALKADALKTDAGVASRRLSPALLTGVALGVITFIAYFLTLSPTINFIDSGEMTTALYTLGVTHPTGYPLYTLLGWLFSNLPLGDDPAWRLNLLSAIFAALAIGLFYALVYNALRLMPLSSAKPVPRNPAQQQPRRKPRKGEPIRPPAAPTASAQPTAQDAQYRIIYIVAAAAAAGLLAGSLTFWSWAVQAKMYTLHWAFVSGLLLLALLVNRAPTVAGTGKGFFGAMPADVRLLHIFALVLGLSLTNHATTVLLIPGLLILILAAPRWTERLNRYLRRLPTLLAALLAPLLLYLYLPISASQHPLMDWGTPSDWPSFIRQVTGWQYSAYLFHPDSKQFTNALVFWRDQFGPILGLVVLICAVAGLVRLAMRDRSLFAATLVIAAAQLFYSLNYGIREIDSYYVPFYMMTLLWAGVGMAWGLQAIVARLAGGAVGRDKPRPDGERAVAAENKPRPYGEMVGLVLLVLPLLAFIINWGNNDHHADRLASLYVQNAYKGFAQNALVMTDSWDLVSGSFYAQYIRAQRPDLTIVDISLMRYPWYMDYLERRHPELIALVGDVEKQYRAQQELFVNDKLNLSDPAAVKPIQDAYIGVVKGMVQGSLPNRPVYALFPSAMNNSPLSNEQAAVTGDNYYPEGMALRVAAAPGAHVVAAPDWDLSGITSGDRVPQDEVALSVTGLYPAALSQIGNYKLRNGQPDGQQLLDQAQHIADLLRRLSTHLAV